MRLRQYVDIPRGVDNVIAQLGIIGALLRTVLSSAPAA